MSSAYNIFLILVMFFLASVSVVEMRDPLAISISRMKRNNIYQGRCYQPWTGIKDLIIIFGCEGGTPARGWQSTGPDPFGNCMPQTHQLL